MAAINMCSKLDVFRFRTFLIEYAIMINKARQYTSPHLKYKISQVFKKYCPVHFIATSKLL